MPRSTYYYNVKHLEEVNRQKDEENKESKIRAQKILDEYILHPCYGYKKMSIHLNSRKDEEWATEKVVRRFYSELGLKGLKPRFMSSKPSKHPYGKFTYLLKDRAARYVNEIWATDITYISTASGKRLYYTAVIDLFSRKILSWRLSESLDVSFCMDAVYEAIEHYGIPAIFNTDQGSQYTSLEFIGLLENYGIRISMDGKGRWRDNIIVERTWRTLKYEWIFLKVYKTMEDLEEGLSEFQSYFNGERIHESLGYMTPDEVYEQGCFPVKGIDKTSEGEVA